MMSPSDPGYVWFAIGIFCIVFACILSIFNIIFDLKSNAALQLKATALRDATHWMFLMGGACLTSAIYLKEFTVHKEVDYA